MMRVILMWIWMAPTAYAQWAHPNILSGVAGLGVERSGFWGGLTYPATMEKKGAYAGFFAEKRFMTDLSYYDLGYLGKFGGQPLQVRLVRDGNESLSVTSVSTALSRKVNEELGIAVRLGYAFQVAKGYGSRAHPVAGFGAAFKISSRLKWGIQADGVNDFFASNGGDGYTVRMGLGYMVSDLASLCIEVIKDKSYPVNTTALMSYAFGEQLHARLGYAFQLATLSCALGFRYVGMDMELFSSYHLSLGAGAGLSLSYQFKRVE